jgi:uncharacterized membrane protein
MKRITAGLRQFLTLNYIGVLLGTAFYCLALTPSLLPRPPLFAGIIAGVSFAVGYGVGVGISWLVRQLFRNKEPSRTTKRYAWWVLLAASTVLCIAYATWNTSWENNVRQLIGEPSLHGQHVLIIIGMALAAGLVVLIIGKLIGRAILAVSTFVDKWLPAYVSFLIGVVAVGSLGFLLYNGIVVKQFVKNTNTIYSKVNTTTPQGVTPTNRQLRSGSPDSLVSWQSLGYQGRNFIGNGPTKEQIAAQSNKPAAEPIRVYVGLETAKSARLRADIAVRELERTGAFKRPVLVVAGSTGTGWIEPRSADALEYIWNGNSAIVTAQYSYLPSWISFLVDQRKASETSTALFDAIYAKWQTLPADARPKLISYGLSLGSFGAQSAFTDAADISTRTDGALYMGTPHFTEPWRTIENTRDKGSPEWQPRYQQGTTVRFAASNADLKILHTQASWKQPRVLYMQHASDPVVWWSYDLLWQKPDWLKEKRGPDVSPNMQWYPFVTFAQVSVDQFFGVTAPDGHGHNYGKTIVDAWASVLKPADWTAEKAQRIQAVIDTYPDE